MRFIQVAFVIATSATFTLFNTYVYAMPAEMSSLDSAKHLQAEWCDGYSDDQCKENCTNQGYNHHVCSVKCVQPPS